MDQGQVIDSGRHDELIARCELYQRLARLQFGPEADLATPSINTAPVALID
jgi:hypothetical protein